MTGRPLELAALLLVISLLGGRVAWAQNPEDPGGLTPPAQFGEEEIPRPDVQMQPPPSITNMSDAPLHLRLRRSRGACWTEEIVIAAGEKREILAGLDREDILGLGQGVPVPYIVVQFPQAPGYVRLKLTGRTGPERDVLMPYYFFAKDSNNIGRMLQAPDIEMARKQQAELLAQPKLAGQALEELIAQAIASGVLHIPASDPPAWLWPPIGTGAIRTTSLIDGPVYFSEAAYAGPTRIGPSYYWRALWGYICW